LPIGKVLLFVSLKYDNFVLIPRCGPRDEYPIKLSLGAGQFFFYSSIRLLSESQSSSLCDSDESCKLFMKRSAWLS
jgi:hypothetical protein